MIKVSKASATQKNYKYKIFLSFFLFSITTLAIIGMIHVNFSQQNNLKKFTSGTMLQSQEKSILLKSFLQKRKNSLLAVANNPYFREFVTNGIYPYNTDFLFYTFMDENKEYMQLRFIDKEGFEKLRFDRRFYGEAAYKVGRLQNKAARYYFKQSIRLKEGEVFFSQIDFNVENGKVQQPYVPVLRVATPIYVQGELKGVLIVNIFIKEFLDLLTSSPIYNIYLAKQDGHLIKYQSHYFDQSDTIAEYFSPDTVQQILETTDKTTIVDKEIYIQKVAIGNQSILMIYRTKHYMQQSSKEENIKMVFIILFITILVSIPFAILLSRPIQEMFELVIKQGDQLHDLATTLDKRVEEEIEKNAKQDRLLHHQAKLAELGEMIGNIAHQWRHPLTRLSLLLQNLKLYKNREKLTDELFFDSLEKGSQQIAFMSTTIDNFQKFYKTENQKEEFLVDESIKSILTIIGHALEHANITLNIHDPNHCRLYANKNQLAQVLLNIIVNAKDALVENNVIDPAIEITLAHDTNQTTIRVEDNAGGIPESLSQDIFEPYFTTKRDKGTGIGLYLSKMIIEDEMGGNISVTNSQNGAVFTITL